METATKVPFVSDRMDRLSDFTNTFQSRDSFYQARIEHPPFIITDLSEFVSDLKNLLAKAVGQEIEIFRNKREEAGLIPTYTVYMRAKELDGQNVLVRFVFSRVVGSPYFTERQKLEITSVYDLSYSFLGDLEVYTKLENFLSAMPTYVYPRQEGVFNINIRELFISGGRMSEHEHHMDTNDFKEVLLSMYPGINMRGFLDSYMESDENIAIFIGKPGTGKTSLLKLLLRETAFKNQEDISAMYVKDIRVLHEPSFWTMMSSSNEVKYLVLDDLDHELLPRDSVEFREYMKSINGVSDIKSSAEALEMEEKKLKLSSTKAEKTIVNQLLSFSDGLFQSKIKVLLTTNLEDTKIDTALTRPGRCFDILSFPKLTVQHALRVWTEDFKLMEADFNRCFKEVLEQEGPAITQSLLASEASEIKRNRLKGGYLTNPTISVRNKYM